MGEHCLLMVRLCRNIAFLEDFESEIIFEACRFELVVSGIHWSLDKWVASQFWGAADRNGSLGGTLLDELWETKAEEPRRQKCRKSTRRGRSCTGEGLRWVSQELSKQGQGNLIWVRTDCSGTRAHMKGFPCTPGGARGSEGCSVCSSTDQVLSYAFWETELCINDKFSLIPNHQM